MNQNTWDGIVSRLKGQPVSPTERVVFVGHKPTRADAEDPPLGVDELNWIE